MSKRFWWVWAQRLQSFYGSLPPQSPVPLALLRIAVAVLILLSPEPQQTRQLVSGPAALLIAPAGLDWLPAVLSWLSPYLHVLHWALNLGCMALIVGFYCRLALLVVAVLFIPLFGGAQLSGTVTHDMHLLWMLLVLLFSPADHALSIDAWREKRALWFAQPSRHASVSVTTARMLLGCVYFFPGLAKLRSMGLEWAESDNLIHHMRLKWFLAQGQVPWPRLDLHPTLVGLGGLSVLAFELGFVVLMFQRHTRLIAGFLGLTFHFATAHFFYIHFPSLWGCYGVLWDGPRAPHEASTRVRSREWAALIFGVGLTSAVAYAGFRRQTQTWPIACYPDFAEPVSGSVWDIAIDVEYADHTVSTLRPSRRRSSQHWGTVWRILGLYDGKPQPHALDAYAQALIKQQTKHAAVPQNVTVYAERYSTQPEHYRSPPLQRRAVHPRAAVPARNTTQ
jgi:hypothetical protein